jgi:hypothetical protein
VFKDINRVLHEQLMPTGIADYYDVFNIFGLRFIDLYIDEDTVSFLLDADELG